MPMFPRRPKPRRDAEQGYYHRVELLEGELLAVLKVCRNQLSTPMWKTIVEKLELSERVELPWTPRFPWEFAEAWAEVGYAIVDQVSDGWYAIKPPEHHIQRELDAQVEGETDGKGAE